METNLETSTAKGKSFSDKLSFWIGLTGSLVTIVLTIWNTHTKSQIDKREEELQTLEIALKERATGIEESKERVERYKWVLTLFPTLNANNEKERNFSVNLVRLALTKDEAEQLFTGLQSSPDTSLQSLGQNGITVIQNEPIAFLVSQMNTEKAEIRKSAVAKLIREYKSSSQAISLSLRMYDAGKFNSLSPSGIINGIYFLKSTDPTVWNRLQVFNAKDVIRKLNRTNPGPQTKAALNQFDEFINKVKPKYGE